MALKIYAGNQLEELARVFCEEIYSGNHSIFEQENVVVQTRGMELFLRKYIAKNTEIAANIETPFLNRFVNDIMRSALDPEEYKQFCFSSEQFSPEVLKWRIFDELQASDGKYKEAEKYIKDSSYCYQLSVKLADTFDRYIWYHNDMLESWRQKKETHWESQLYLALTEKTGPSPDFFFLKFLSGEQKIDRKLPAGHYSLFGIGSMPPILLDLCNALGRETDVHLFYLNPSHEYWGDIISQKNELKEGLPPLNNSIVANLGVWGQEFFENTVKLMSGTERDCFLSPVENGGSTMLHLVQEDIFNNEIRQSSGTKSDRSISVHNCHSRRREIEVLHDQLLLAIKELKISPEDIIVMAPDINAYAPIIEAVFSSGKLANSYNISDRSLVFLSSTAENLLRILGLHAARCTAEEILNIIDSLPVRANFELDDEALAEIKNFISKSKICWGENAETRLEFSQTEFNEFSWQDGLDRLLLGYVSDMNDPLSIPMTPAADIYGSRAELLGTLNFIVTNLFKWRYALKEERTIDGWTVLLNEIIDTMYGKAFSLSQESGFLKRSIAAWQKKAQNAELNSKFSVKVLLEEISSAINSVSDSRGFLSGGITFCSLIPMRSIPAKVIAVLGLAAKDFPRKEENNGLNIRPARKKGERSRLLEERYLFLETLLSARERLLLFYPGQGTNPKVSCSPSAPLEDLMNYLKKYFSFEETKHFRHAHDPGYFSSADPDLVSFSKHHCMIAQNILSPSPDPEKSFQEPAAEPEDSGEISYTISDLAWCLSNPFQTYLANTVKIKEEKNKKYSETTNEPLEGQFSQAVVEDIVKGRNPEDLADELFLKRELPPGEIGKIWFDGNYAKFRKASAFQDVFKKTEKVSITVSVGKFKINGMVDQLPESLNIASIYKYGGSWSLLTFYISNLCSSIQTPRPAEQQDIALIGTEIKTLPVLNRETAAQRLLELLDIAEKAKKSPLPLFSKANLTFATSQKKKKANALTTFTGTKYVTGDMQTTALLDRFFTPESFDDENFFSEFARLSRIVYAPWFVEEVIESDKK